MSLDLTLKDALSGLQASQAALQTISNNIANANTEGYSRKKADPKSLVIGGKGFGVQIGDTLVLCYPKFLEEFEIKVLFREG